MSNVAQENAPLLNAIGLKKYYPVKKGMFAKTQQVKALDGVSFSLERGKTLAVVGESGCGKSTLYMRVWRNWQTHQDRKSTRLNSSHSAKSRMPSSA